MSYQEALPIGRHDLHGGPHPQLPRIRENELLALLTNSPVSVLKYLNESVTFPWVSRALTKGQAVEAQYHLTETSVTLRQRGLALSVVINNIDSRKFRQEHSDSLALGITSLESVVDDIEHCLSRAIKRGEKARLNMKVTPKGMTVVLEQSDYNGQWSVIFPELGWALSEPEAVAYFLARVDFDRADSALRQQETASRPVSSPPPEPLINAPVTPEGQIRIGELQKTVKNAEEYMDRVARMSNQYRERGELDYAENVLFKAKLALRQEIALQQETRLAAAQAANKGTDTAGKPWKKRDRKNSSYAKKHGFR